MVLRLNINAWKGDGIENPGKTVSQTETTKVVLVVLVEKVVYSTQFKAVILQQRVLKDKVALLIWESTNFDLVKKNYNHILCQPKHHVMFES